MGNVAQFNDAGQLSWDDFLSLDSDFTGHIAIDDDGNIYALFDHGDSTCRVDKYDPDGNFVVSTSTTTGAIYQTGDGIAWSRDKTEGRETLLYIWGHDPDYPDYPAYYWTFNADLEWWDWVELDGNDFPITQLETDNHGNDYVVGGATNKIYKFRESYMLDGVYQWAVKYWDTSIFSESSDPPVITVTDEGIVYAAGQVVIGGWATTFGLDYWAPMGGFGCNSEWDGTRYNLTDSYIICLEVNGVWPQDITPTKARFTFGGSSIDLVEGISIYVENAGGHSIEISDHDLLSGPDAGDPFWMSGQVELLLDTIPEGYFLKKIYFWTDWAFGGTVHISNIEFFEGVPTPGIAVLSTDGVLTGFIARDTTIQEMALDGYGNIIVKEDDSVVSAISRLSGDEQWSYDTEKNINTFVLDVSRRFPVDNFTGRIGFSSDEITVVGEEGSIVQSTGGKIVFSQHTGFSINGDRVIYPSVGNIVFKIDNVLFGGQYQTGPNGEGLVVSPCNITVSSETDITIPVVVPAGKIEFHSPSPLEGNHVAKPNGKITFLNETDIIGSHVTITPQTKKIEFYSNPTVDGTQVSLKPKGAVEFTAVPPDIEGTQTIIRASGAIELAGVRPVIFAFPAPTNGLAIMTPPATMGFISNRVHLNEQAVYATGNLRFGSDAWARGSDDSLAQVTAEFPSLDIDMAGGAFLQPEFPGLGMESRGTNGHAGRLATALPALSFEMHAGGLLVAIALPSFTLAMEATRTVLASLAGQLPAFSMESYSGGLSSAELPLLGMEAYGTTGSAGLIQLTFPVLSLSTQTGGISSVELPLFDIDMAATTTVPASLNVQLPALQFSGVASRASEGDIDITLPGLQAAMTMTTGIVGSMVGTLPIFSMGIVGLPGATADLEGTFRIMKFSGIGGPSGPGTIEADFPVLEMSIESGDVESGVLRYVRERVT